jgi:hypothetical protein
MRGAVSAGMALVVWLLLLRRGSIRRHRRCVCQNVDMLERVELISKKDTKW